MNYKEMSDFEINGYVSMHVHGFSWIEFVDGCASHVKCGNERYPGFAMVEVSDYCNNPSDAWPIISESKINLVSPIETRNSWTASHTKGGGNWNLNDASVVHENPLRAAMIVFLMMQEQVK